MRTEAERTVAGQRVSPVIPSARLSNAPGVSDLSRRDGRLLGRYCFPSLSSSSSSFFFLFFFFVFLFFSHRFFLFYFCLIFFSNCHLVSNKHCPPVYDSTEGAITANTNNQVAAIMHYKEWRLCSKSWMLTFISVAVIVAFMQWQQRLSFVLTMTQLVGYAVSHGNTINFTHTFRDA